MVSLETFPEIFPTWLLPFLGGSGMSQPWGSFPAYNKYENFTERQPVWQTPHSGKGSVWLLLASTDSSQTGLSPSQWLWEPHYAAGTHVMVLFVAATRGRGGAGPLGGGGPTSRTLPSPCTQGVVGIGASLVAGVARVARGFVAGRSSPPVHSLEAQPGSCG